MPPTNVGAEARPDGRPPCSRARLCSRRAPEPRSRSTPGARASRWSERGWATRSMFGRSPDLGIDDDACGALGLRLVQLAMPWPLDRDDLRGLVADVETVLVVEDKLPFVEALVKEALYRSSHSPLVIGKEDGRGRAIAADPGPVSADDVARALGPLLSDRDSPEPRRHASRRSRERAATALDTPLPRRTPYFCSGCPHNTSTRCRRPSSSSASESAATRWSCSTAATVAGGSGSDPDGRRGRAVARSRPVHGRSRISSRTSVMARFTTPPRLRCAQRSRLG